MTTVLRLVSMACLLILATPTPQATAAEPTEEAKRQAAEFYMEAQRLFDQELYAAAVENFKRAQELYSAPANLYNIAKCYERLGDSQNCVDYYDAYLKAFQEAKGMPAPDSVDVRNSIAKCRLGAKVSVRVASKPEGANIRIDDKGKLLGQTPYETKMDPGTYTIYLDLKGHQPVERELTVRAGEPLQLVFELEKIRRVGTIRVNANIRGATIFIDGANIGLTPYGEEIEVEEGLHQVTVSKEDYETHSSELTVMANESYEVKAELFLRDPPSTAKGPLGWTSIAVGAALTVGGVLAGKEADTKFKGTDDFDKWARLQKIGYGTGGAMVGVGLTLVILEFAIKSKIKPKDKLSDGGPRPVIVPILSATGSGGFAGARVDF